MRYDEVVGDFCCRFETCMKAHFHKDSIACRGVVSELLGQRVLENMCSHQTKKT